MAILHLEIDVELPQPEDCEEDLKRWAAESLFVSWQHSHAKGLLIQAEEDYVPLGYLRTMGNITAKAEWRDGD